MRIEEKKLFREISDKIDKLIDELFEKYGYDRAYYNFIFKVEILDNELQPVELVNILEDVKVSTCAFCGKETRFYDKDLDLFLCFEHFLKKRYGFKTEDIKPDTKKV